MADLRRARLTVWSDYACPFCYLEEAAVASGAVPYSALRRLVEMVRRGATPAGSTPADSVSRRPA